jgi:hypothetical protein
MGRRGGEGVTYRSIALPKIPRPPQPKRPHHHQRHHKRNRRAHRRRHVLFQQRLPILQPPGTRAYPWVQREIPWQQRLRKKINRPRDKQAYKLRHDIQPHPSHKHSKRRRVAEPRLEPVAPPPLLLDYFRGRDGAREVFGCAVEGENVRLGGGVLF